MKVNILLNNEYFDIILIMSFITEPYSHIPTFAAIATGVAFGAARIGAGELLNGYFLASSGAAALPPVSLMMITFVAFRCILVPFFEEAMFRKDLLNPTAKEVVRSSVLFGLMHGLLPGSLEVRMARVFASTIGGFFYCGARVVGGDTWSSAIAHSMYNLRWITQLA